MKYGPAAKIAAHAYVVAVGCVFLAIGDPVYTLIGTGLVAALIYGWLAWTELNSGIPLNPLSFHFAWYTAAFGLAAVHYGSLIAHNEPITFVVKQIEYKDLAYGYVLCLIGSFILHCVFQWMRPNKEITYSNRKLNPLVAIVVFALGLATLVVPPELFTSGALAGIFQNGPFAVLMLLAIRDTKPRFFWPKMLLGTGLIVGSTLVSFATSYKMFAMVALFPLLIYLWKHHRRAMFAYGTAVAILYLTVVAPTINKSREIRTLDPVERMTRAFNSYSLSDEGFISKQWDGFLERIFEPYDVAFLINTTHLTGFQHGATMGNLVYGFVPRILWPDKPAVSRGLWFTAFAGDDSKSSTAMSHVGEFYWNWGLPGVIVGMTLLAFLYAGLWRYAAHFGLDRLWGMMIYFMVTVSMVNSSEASTMMLSAIILYMAIFAVICWRWFLRFIRESMQTSEARQREIRAILSTSYRPHEQ